MTAPSPDLASALAHLPHGPEFRFIDRLLELAPGARAVAEYQVRGDEPFLPGHFPGDPMFPGVLLIEACAQLAGVAAQSDPLHAPLPGLRLTAVRAAKIIAPARPGDVITLHARVSGRLGRLIQAQCGASVRGALVAQCEITLAGAGETPPPEAPACSSKF